MNKANRKNLFAKNFAEVGYMLDNIDWVFPSKSLVYEGVQPFDCRKHHWFPATFIPEIPFTLIEVLTHPGATVYDPFAGIGTTYFQALLLNRRPLATEICKVAVEFMRSLFVLFDPLLDFESIQKKAIEIVDKFNPSTNYVEKVRDDPKINILIDKLQPWYNKNTFNQLAYLFLAEHSCDNRHTNAAIRISISAILRKACSQDRGWGCIADNVLPKQAQIAKNDKNAIAFFRMHLNRLLTDLEQKRGNVAEGYDSLYNEVAMQETIFHADAKKVEKIPDSSVDLVVTSPPYPNMTDYVKSQRLSYYWLGMPLSMENSDLVLEIGARRNRHVKDSLERYLTDMQACIEVLSPMLKQGGYVCFVMPEFGTVNQNDSSRKRVIEKTILDLERFFGKEKGEFERTIPAVRRSHNIKWATLEKEHIFIFQNAK